MFKTGTEYSGKNLTQATSAFPPAPFSRQFTRPSLQRAAGKYANMI